MKMEMERNNASVLVYYGVEDRSADCQTFLFRTGEPVKVDVLPQIAPVYCLLSVSVSALQKRLPLASVVRRLYGWLDAACVYEFNAHSREKQNRPVFAPAALRSRQPSGCSHSMRVPLHSLWAGWTLLR